MFSLFVTFLVPERVRTIHKIFDEIKYQNETRPSIQDLEFGLWVHDLVKCLKIA